jgi:hypothetical protein
MRFDPRCTPAASPRLALVAVGAALVPALAVAPPARLAAQQGAAAVALGGGPSPFDLGGTGTGIAAAAQLAWYPLGPLVVEPGVTFFTHGAGPGARASYLFPELSVQVEGRLGRARPVVGAGAGAALALAGPASAGATLHAAVGLRLDLDRRWAVRAEGRARTVRPWSGNTTDFVLGLSRRLR